MTERALRPSIIETQTVTRQPEQGTVQQGDMQPGVEISLQVAAAMNTYSAMKSREGIDPHLVGQSMQNLLKSINSEKGLAALKKLSSIK